MIRRIKAPCKPWLPCGDNLYLRCHSSSKGELTKRWFYRSGKTGFRSLGASWPTMSLREARKHVDLIRVGERNIKDIGTVRELGEDFYSTNIAGRRRDATLVRGYLDREVLPVIGGMKVRDVASDDVMRVLKPIVARGSRVAANRCLDVLRLLFDYGAAHGLVKGNPCLPIKKRHVGGVEKPRARVLTVAETKSFFEAAAEAPELPMYRLLLLTGLRVNELLHCERSMVCDGVLTLPAELMKGRRTHKIYLAPSMLAELEACMAKHASRFIFPAELDPKKPFPKTSLQQRWMKVRPEGVTLHDLRRTMRTGCGELGIRPDICEMMLAHKLRGIQATYDRYDYGKELRAAWRLWAEKVTELSS